MLRDTLRNRGGCNNRGRRCSARNVEEVDEQDSNTHIVGVNEVTWQVKINKLMYAQVRRDLSAIVSGARSYRVRARS